MDIERLKELVQAEDSDLWDYKVELIGLLDEAIARQSVKSEECGQFYLDRRGYDYCPNCGRKIKED